MSTYDNGGLCCPRCRRGSDLEVATMPAWMTGGIHGRPVVRCGSCRHEDPDFRRVDEHNRRENQAEADRHCAREGHRFVELLGKCVTCNRHTGPEEARP